MSSRPSSDLYPVYISIFNEAVTDINKPSCICLSSGEHFETIGAMRIALDAVVQAGIRKSFYLHQIPELAMRIPAIPSRDQILNEKLYVLAQQKIQTTTTEIIKYFEDNLLPPYFFLEKGKKLINKAFITKLYEVDSPKRNYYFNTISQLMILWFHSCNRDSTKLKNLLNDVKSDGHSKSIVALKNFRKNNRTEKQQNDLDWNRAFSALKIVGEELVSDFNNIIREKNYEYRFSFFSGLGKSLYKRCFDFPFMNYSNDFADRATILSEFMVGNFTKLMRLAQLLEHNVSSTMSSMILDFYLRDWFQIRSKVFLHITHRERNKVGLASV